MVPETVVASNHNRHRPLVLLGYLNYGPYHLARLREARQQQDLEVLGLELAKLQSEYAWDTSESAEVISLLQGRSLESIKVREWPGLVSRCLDELQPDVCAIAGYSHPGMLAILAWASQHQRPAILMSDSMAEGESRAWYKEWIKRHIVGLYSSGFVAGHPHRNYLVELGLAEDRTFLGYDVVDNDYFRKGTEKLKSEMLKGEDRKQFGLPEKYFLASARFIGKKNLPRLIQAYAGYRELAQASDIGHRKSEIWDLVLLGDGPLRETLNSQLSTLNLHADVQMPGFKQYPDLPTYYGLAGAFIHGSVFDEWGLVVNEAMASGLPIIVSNRCGCAADLVQEGVNGFSFDPYDIEQLAQLMFQISAFPAFRLSAFGDASRDIIANWGPERFASGLKAAVDCALNAEPVKATILQRFILRVLLAR